MTPIEIARDAARLEALLTEARDVADRLSDRAHGAEADVYSDTLGYLDDAASTLHTLPGAQEQDRGDAAFDAACQRADARDKLAREYAAGA